jgi:Zn-finger protein
MENSERFFRNVDCKYFSCHEGCDPERFNCLFCFCPLYSLGEECGGNFRYVGEDRKVKSCMECALPHDPAFYDAVMERLRELAAIPRPH